MAVPKQKQSKGRTRRRRAHHALNVPSMVKCSHCNKMIEPHKVCPFCGHWKDKEVVNVLDKLKKH